MLLSLVELVARGGFWVVTSTVGTLYGLAFGWTAPPKAETETAEAKLDRALAELRDVRRELDQLQRSAAQNSNATPGS